VAQPIDRRTFLRRGSRTLGGAAALGVLGPAVLDACSSSSSSSASSSSASAGATATTAAGSSAAPTTAAAAANFGSLDFQLPWVKNVESAGEYIADSKGYFTAAGFSSVNLIAGGPNATPQETVVQTKRALIAVSSLDATSAAISKGANLICIGAQYQKNPFCIMSPAAKPIKTPQDMIGKKIGVQAPNDSIWTAFLQANSIDPSKVTKVPVSFDPTPLTQGTVDAWFSFITNEPIALKQKNFDTVTFLLADFNYPEVGNAYIVRTDSLQSDRAKVLAAMAADIKGWLESLGNHQEGADLAANKYGQGLDATEQALESAAQNLLITAGSASTNGIFYVAPADQAANVKTLGLGGTTVTTDKLFDMTLLDDLFKAHPELKTIPAAG